MRDWFAIHTHVRSEFIAQQNLERQGYSTYLPLFRTTRSHARKIEVVSVPLFPRYIFVGLRRGMDGWSKIKYSRGVTNIVSFGLKPAIVSQKILQCLRDREDDSGFVNFRHNKNLIPGDKVNIIEGFFAQNSGVIEKISGNDRVSVLLDLLDRQFRLTMSRGSVSLSV